MKRIISLFLVIMLLTGCLSLSYAEETPSVSLDAADQWVCPVCGQTNTGNFCPNDAEPRPQSSEASGLGVQAGDSVTFGSYPQGADGEAQPIEWLVLETDGDRAFLLSRYVLTCHSYHSFDETTDGAIWKNSSLREWMNGEFFSEAFTPAEQKRILLSQVDNSAQQGNPDYQTTGSIETLDRIFALSYAEALRYLPTNEDRIGDTTPYAKKNTTIFTSASTYHAYWWLRSPGSSWSMNANVGTDGTFGQHSYNNISEGVRPAMWIRLSNETDDNSTTSTEETIAAETSAEETSAEATSAEETSSEETSATEETSAEETSAEETSVTEETSAEETVAEETATKETSAEETSAEETSAEETSATEETSAEETSAEETVAEETATKETSAEETSAEATSAEETAASGETSAEGRLFGYLSGTPTVYSLLKAADEALSNGIKAKEVGNELYALAEENELTDMLLWYGENLAAYGNKNYRRINTFFSDKDQELNLLDRQYSDLISGIDAYGHDIEVSDELKKLLHSGTAEYCYTPVYWGEDDFKDCLGTAYKSFKPSSSRAGYVCVVIKESSQSEPETSWRDADNDDFSNAFWSTFSDMIESLGSDVPIFTGNPNLASTFWVFELKYPYYARYGDSEPYIKGYHCTVSMSVVNASKHSSVIAELSATNRLADTIYKWHDYVAEADAPVLSDESSYSSFIEKIRTALVNERSKAVSSKTMTGLNAETVLNGILVKQAEKTKDAWQKAIYSSGARDVTLTDDLLTFTLRAYDPQLSALGKYDDAENKTGWLMSALENSTAYTLELSVPVKDGEITSKGLSAIKTAVQKAAKTAKSSFKGKEFSAALIEYLFPSPLGEEAENAEELTDPSESFIESIASLGSVSDLAPVTALSALFYAQKSQKLTADGGPDALVLSCVGADPAALITEAYQEVLDSRAYVTKDARDDSYDGLEEDLQHTFAEKTFAAKKKCKYKFSVTVSLDDLLKGQLPAEYTDYLKLLAYEDTMNQLYDATTQLLDIAALTLPSSGRLSGSSSGTSVRFKNPSETNAAYFQMRSASTNEKVVTCFVEPGKSAKVRVPKGDYIFLYASGPYWYGEELLFGNLCTMEKSETTEIKGKNYEHTITMNSAEGNVSMFEADSSDFE